PSQLSHLVGRIDLLTRAVRPGRLGWPYSAQCCPSRKGGGRRAHRLAASASGLKATLRPSEALVSEAWNEHTGGSGGVPACFPLCVSLHLFRSMGFSNERNRQPPRPRPVFRSPPG